MRSFSSKRGGFRQRLLLAAPEADPHEFVRRYVARRLEAAKPPSLPARLTPGGSGTESASPPPTPNAPKLRSALY